MKDTTITYEIMARKDGVYHPFIASKDFETLIKDKLDPEGWKIITITRIKREIIWREL